MLRALALPTALLTLAFSLPARAESQAGPQVRGYLNDSSLAFLKPFLGRWRPVVTYAPPGQSAPARVVAEDYRWAVGAKAILYRENYPFPAEDSAQVVGMIYWNPSTERVEYLGVSGTGVGQGHLYQGEYHELEDGSVERVFEGFYRTLEDIPGDAFGGTRRRFRQRFEFVTPDTIAYQLEWFHNGAWRPFGRFARNTLVRLPR